MSATPDIDFFVSYNSADRPWAVWIAWQVEAAGYTTVLQAWDFVPGSNFVLEMDRASKRARRTLLVLSPDYLAATFPQAEWAAAFASDPASESHNLIPIRVRDCELKGLLALIVYIDLVGRDETAAHELLVQGIRPEQRHKPEKAPAFPGEPEREEVGPPRFPGSSSIDEHHVLDSILRETNDAALERFDRRFQGAVESLASGVELRQVSGVAILESLLVPAHRDEHELIYRVLCANLGIRQPASVRQALVRAFAKALRLHLGQATEQGRAPELRLARCHLARADLAGLDLSHADFAFADMGGADLSNTRLFRARGYLANLNSTRLHEANLEEARLQHVLGSGAKFHKARLVSTVLKHAELRGAEFPQALMQGAHFEDADLRGARFEEANLADTYFYGVVFDDTALRSILRTSSWRDAHFDRAVYEQLLDLDMRQTTQGNR